MEELQEIEIQEIELEEYEIIGQEQLYDLREISTFEEEGLYFYEVDALNALVVQNYIIISLLLVIILLKRKWVEIK